MPSSHSRRLTRREVFQLGGTAALAGFLAPTFAFAAADSNAAPGAVVGDRVAAKIGEDILRNGGNAIDAAIAAAFAAGIASPHNCGVGGYGGHAVIALAGGRKFTAIDFNSTAPAAAHVAMFSLDAAGKVKNNANMIGWLAAGVPGTLAGLELVLTRYGTRSLRDVLAPAIELCESERHVAPAKGIDDLVAKAAAPDALPSEKRRNAALARFLRTLAKRNSAESFYRGDFAGQVAAAFERNGGLVTRADLAAFHARELAPLTLEWNGATIHAPPLPSTGPLLVEAFAVLKALEFDHLDSAARQHAKLEALRIAWADRLRHFGDPDHVRVPLDQLLSPAYARDQADKVRAALQEKRPVPLDTSASRADGTTNISAADAAGNMIAITLTHGGGFGAKVVVDELGIVLGHGMSRFDPRPGLPNSVGPRKRPITNMAPLIVARHGIPVLALGASGGTRIPNSLYEVVLNLVGLRTSLADAMNAPRLDSMGTLTLGLEKKHTATDETFYRNLGYTITRHIPAMVSAVEFEPSTRSTRGMSVGGA